ncbi:MAG: sensor histidine kinase [Lachnospiraceae bacterium]
MDKKKRHSIRVKMMVINILIALVSFLLCGGLFVFSAGILIRKYVDSDMDFFLTEISDNLSEKFEYMEETISEIRHSSILMDFLQSGYEYQMESEVQKEFSHLIDINNLDNQRTNWKPIIEEVYLFREQGEFVADYYYMLVSENIEESRSMVHSVWQEFLQHQKAEQGFVSYVVMQDQSMYVACSVLDDKMEVCGSVIFDISQEAVHTIMEELHNYEGAFWIIYDEHKNMLDGIYENIALEEISSLDASCKNPCSGKVYGENYRLFHTELGVDLNVVLGIPENHAVRILYDSIDIYIVMILAILAVGILSFAVFTYKITKPLEEVAEKLKSVQNGDFQTKMPEYEEKEFYEISNGFNRMTSEIDHLITEVYQKQILLKELELKFLQSQLNPHFIFNVLNAIGLQAKLDGNDQISRMISAFSQLIQAKIYRSDLEKVQIRQELEYAKYYLEIQKFRYGERLSYSIDVDERLKDFYIQKLCIQLIVENAVIHGLEPKMSGGTVSIRGFEEDDHIAIEITDDGVGFSGQVELPIQNTSAGKSHNQVGLNSMHAILQLRYGKEYGLTIQSEKGKGTKVTIRIPFDSGLD